MAAANNAKRANDCIFCKIIEGGLPAYKVYEDTNVMAFLDIFPIHPGHVLVVPKRHYTDIFDTPEKDLQNVIAAAKKISPAVMKATNADAINIGMNNRPASGQVVMHTHLHVIPRYKDDGLKTWPQRPYNNDAEKEHVAAAIKSSL
ncbi:HIT family protein [Candidatus Woesearchaeota archaeon]|nr:HIT family protein [Candidatus Woesearchaeota archaeon]